MWGAPDPLDPAVGLVDHLSQARAGEVGQLDRTAGGSARPASLGCGGRWVRLSAVSSKKTRQALLEIVAGRPPGDDRSGLEKRPPRRLP